MAAEKAAEGGIRTGASRVLEARYGGDTTESNSDRGKDYPGKIPESHHQSKAETRPIRSECVQHHESDHRLDAGIGEL
jgi:hypothetical protein